MQKIISILILFLLTACTTNKSVNFIPEPKTTTTITTEKAPDEVIWREFGFKALLKAKVKNKFIILHIYSPNCQSCNIMKYGVYKDPEIVHIINERFILTELNGEVNPEIVANFTDYSIYPMTVFLTPSGISLGIVYGAISIPAYKKMLNIIVEAADSP